MIHIAKLKVFKKKYFIKYTLKAEMLFHNKKATVV